MQSIQSTSRLGTGVVVPYFIPIGTDKDITLTPDISPKTRMLEVGYRQIVNKGSFTFDGAISDDDIESASLRAYGRIVGRLHVLMAINLGSRCNLFLMMPMLGTINYIPAKRWNRMLR